MAAVIDKVSYDKVRTKFTGQESRWRWVGSARIAECQASQAFTGKASLALGPLQSRLLNVSPKFCRKIPSEGLCVSLLILEAAHAFSLVPLRRAFSLEWEGVDCFHLLKVLLLYLPNQQSCFARVAEMKSVFLVHCEIPCCCWLCSALCTPLVQTGPKSLTQGIEIAGRMPAPTSAGPPERRVMQTP